MDQTFIYLLVSFIGGIAGNLIAAWIQKDRWGNIFSRSRLLLTFIVAGLAIGTLAFLDRGNEMGESGLYIVEQRSKLDTFLVEGEDVNKYAPGDTLVVYDESVPEIEEPVALLRVVSKNPDSLIAQIILHNPERPIRTRFRVDDQVEKLSRGELVPFEESFVGYLIGEGSIALRETDEVEVGDLLQVYQDVTVDGLTVDFKRSETKLLVTDMGFARKTATVKLESGKWPKVGSVMALIAEDADGFQNNDPLEAIISPTTTPYSGPCTLELLETVPASPQIVGTAITIRMRGVCETGVRAIRLFINDEWVDEKGGHIAPPEEFNYFWRTENLESGEYQLVAEVATWGDDQWEFSSSKSLTYTLVKDP